MSQRARSQSLRQGDESSSILILSSPRGAVELLYSSAAETREFVGVCGRKAWEGKQKKEKKKQGASERDTSLSEKASLQQQQHAHDTHTQLEKSRQCLWWVDVASSLPVRVKLILPSEVKHFKKKCPLCSRNRVTCCFQGPAGISEH